MNLNLWHKYDIPKIDTPTGRKYIVDGEEFTSVTTFLSSFGNEAIETWKQNIGESAANRISKLAAVRGTQLHSWIEKFIMEGKDEKISPIHINLKRLIKPLIQRLDEVNLIEAPIYSRTMKLAGTVDCVGVFDGELSVIDFKTSSKPKKKEWITNYFLQASIYSYMIDELYGVKIPRINIMIAVENQPVQLFSENRINWRQDIKNNLTIWRKQNGK